MLGEYLPLRELQSILNEDQLNEIAYLVARTNPASNVDPLSDRTFLGRVYDAYFGPDLLKTQRKRLLDYVPPQRVLELAGVLGVSTDGSISQVVGRVTRLPWGPNEATLKFLEYFGYPEDYAPTDAGPLASKELLEPYGEPLRPLFDYQASVYHRTTEALESPCSRAMLQMPTGSGKTRTAMQVVASFLNGDLSNRLVVWLAHSEELCDQASDALQHVWAHLGMAPVTIHRWWGARDANPVDTRPAVVIGGFAKLNNLRGTSPGLGADLVVVDEAHRVLAPTYDAAVRWARSASGRVLGLSATPGRVTGENVENARLAGYFNDVNIGIDAGDYGVIELLQNRGILARAEREALETNISFHLTKEEWEQLEDGLDYPSGFLRRLAEDRERNRLIFERLLELSREGLRILVFATSVEQSRILCAMLVYHGIQAVHIDGGTSTQTRRGSLSRFKEGDVQVITNYEVLTTGFDAPGIDVVFLARPTKSLVLYSQMIGRGMRGPNVGGTPYFRLVDVIDNITDYSSDLDDVYEYFAGYWG